MIALAVRRILLAVPAMLVVIAIAFALLRAAPGGPFSSALQAPADIERRLLAEYDRDLPVHLQFASYLGRLARADLGPSMTYRDKEVADIIAEGLPTSAVIGLGALGLALAGGGVLGVAAAVRRDRALDHAVMAAAILGACLAPLVSGPLTQWWFGVEIAWLPAGGLYRDELRFEHLFLPIVTLALPLTALVTRLMRASMIETLRSNAIRTARAKGLPEAQVIWRHALPSAALPIVSYAGPALAAVLTGSLVIETVFELPGVGRQLVIGALSRDYTLVMGVAIVYAFFIIVFTLAADLAYRALDPRARQA